MVDFLLSAVSSSCCWGVGQRGMATVSCVVLVVVVRGQDICCILRNFILFQTVGNSKAGIQVYLDYLLGSTFKRKK